MNWKSIIACLFLLVANTTKAELVTFLGATYEMEIPQSILETSVPWKVAKPSTEAYLRRSAPVAKENLAESLAKAGEKKASELERAIEKICTETGMSDLEVAAIFQGNTGRKKYPEVQKLHDQLAGTNHLLDVVLLQIPTAVKTLKTVGQAEKEKPEQKTRSMEW